MAGLRLGGATVTTTTGADILGTLKTSEGLVSTDSFQIKKITFYPLADTTVKIHNTYIPLTANVLFVSDMSTPRQIVFSTTGTTVKISYAY